MADSGRGGLVRQGRGKSLRKTIGRAKQTKKEKESRRKRKPTKNKTNLIHGKSCGRLSRGYNTIKLQINRHRDLRQS